MWREKIKSILSWQKGREAKGRAEKKEFPELRGKQDKKELFQKAILLESRKAIQNPGCGWYHLYTFNAAQTGEPLYIACEEEELVLLRIDIGAFRDKPISEPSLEWIRRILAFFREKRKGMILRFSYDLEGKGLEKEPGSIRLVEEHMQQIGEVIREYADDIFAVQGILIGNWGEMHGSRYLTPDAFRTLTDTMIKAVDGACPVAVRKPAQWRELTLGWTEQEKKKLTLFNDGIFGSETDLGTYGTLSPETPGQKICSREEELEWQKNEMCGKFCGGEAIWGSGAEPAPFVSAPKAMADLERMHISYLNSTYDLRRLEQWKAETVEDESGLEAIGKRLGYRFVVEGVEFVSEREELQITLENKGFAELTEEADCYLELERNGTLQKKIQIATDARLWKSGEKTTLCQKIKLPAELAEPEEQKLYLALYRRRDGRTISFANQGEKQGRPFLGIFKIDPIVLI